MLLFKEAFLNFVGNLTLFFFFYFSSSFGEMLEESYKFTKAILLIQLDCIEEPVILPSIDHLFFLHVSRPSWFLTKEYIFSFSIYLHFFISPIEIKTFQTWWSKMPYSWHSITNENTETLNKRPWAVNVYPFPFNCSFFAVTVKFIYLLSGCYKLFCLDCIMVLNI